MIIRAHLRLMASSEILGMISPEKYREIKNKDPRPMFKAFVIGHEGESRGNIVGIGNIIKTWFKSAIAKMHDRITAGIQLFHGHGATNETAGRVPIGEVVGKKLIEIKDRLSSVVACYIYPEFRNLPLDVASIEADLNLRPNEDDKSYVAEIENITAIALGNSLIDKPGFPGATLLGQLQAFAEKNRPSGGGENMTLEEIRSSIQEAKFRPSDVFDPEALFADPVISEQVKEKISNARGYDFRKFESLSQQRADLEKKLEDEKKKFESKEQEIAKLRMETVTAKVPILFEKRKTDRKLTDQQVKFITKDLEEFRPTKPEDVEKEFDVYLDRKIDDFKKIAKDVFGIEDKTDGKGRVAGGEPDTTKEPISENEKYLNPATNPMIKTD